MTPAEVETLTRELRALMSSLPGLRVRHIGPTLRRLCAIAETDRDDDAVVAVAQWLLLLVEAANLNDDLRICAMGAFGLHEEPRPQILTRRVEWIAARIGCDTRTAWRRLDAVAAQLASAAERVGSRLDYLLARRGEVEVQVTQRGTDVAGGDPCVWRGAALTLARHVDQPDEYFLVLDRRTTFAMAIPVSRVWRIDKLDEPSL